VGSVKRCKNPKCNKIFYPSWNENRSEFCPDCRKRAIRQDVYRMKHDSARVGNSKQDSEILSFLKKKRDNEDKKYANIFKNKH
jgi:hypothetical protein